MAIGTPVKVIRDDKKRKAKLDLANATVAAVDAQAQAIIDDKDLDLDDQMGLLMEFNTMRGWARTARNNLALVFQPTVQEPEPLEPLEP